MAEGFLKKMDAEIYQIVRAELERQRNTLGLIAAENYASPAVLEAQASVLQNKYSEGYPRKRYYGGNQFIDQAESLAIERAKKLFGANFANVQAHAGAPMNMAVYFALLELGDKFMGLQLSQGGHLTHGSPVNFSGKWYRVAAYALNPETERLDYDAIRRQALAEKPKLIQCGYTAYPRQIDFRRFREIADEVGACMMADVSHIAGLIAGGAHPSSVPHAHVTTTTTHKTLRGPRGGLILCNDQEIAQKIDKAVFPGLQGGPFEHIIAAKAVCFKEAMAPEFSEYAHQIVKNARALAEELMAQGFRLVSGGTDTHLMLVDFTKTHPNLTGKEAQIKLEAVGIVCNKNTVPGETRSPFVTSGIRLGTPMVTTRGMKEGEMKVVGQMIATTLNARDEATVNKVKADVSELCRRFPIYPELG